MANDGQVGLEIQLEHPQRFANIGRRGRDGHQRQDHIALAHVILHPFQIDGDVAFHEMKARVAEQRADALGLQVHAVNMPIGMGQDVLAQVMADKSIDAKNQNVFQNEPLLMIFRRVRAVDATARAARYSAPPARHLRSIAKS